MKRPEPAELDEALRLAEAAHKLCYQFKVNGAIPMLREGDPEAGLQDVIRQIKALRSYWQRNPKKS